MATTMSSVLGEHGKRMELVDPDTGRVWEVRFITHMVMTEFEQWMRKEAMAAVMEQKPLVAPEEYAEMLREVTRDFASGTYAYQGPLCQRALATPGGAIALSGILLWDAKAKRNPTREELSDLMRRRSAEVDAMIQIVGEESRQRLRPASDGGGEEGFPPQPATTSTPS